MIERDYLMRMVDLLVKALARVMLHRKACDYPQALSEIDSACKTLIGMGRNFVNNFADTQLIEMFDRDPETSGSKCYILGVLLKEEADIVQLQGNNDEALGLYAKSLSLLLTAFVHIGAPASPDHSGLIEETRERLQGCEIPPSIMEKELGYYESTGRFDKAEDILFDLVELDAQYASTGLQFYDRLLKKSDDELGRGHLPRTEVHEGMLKLREMHGGTKAS